MVNRNEYISILQKFTPFLINKDRKIISKIERKIFYNDEPKIFTFAARLKRVYKKFSDYNDIKKFPLFASGSSFIKEIALIKTLGEATERFALCCYREKNFIKGTHNDLCKRKLPLLPLSSFQRFNDKTKEILRWVHGFKFEIKKSHVPLLIPSQMIYVPYVFLEYEPIFTEPISTGAAAGLNFKDAFKRGLLEVIERDSFMLYYLGYFSPLYIISTKQDFVYKLKKYFERYNLELHLLYFKTDIPVYTIGALIMDKTMIGPPVCLGLKSGFDLEQTIMGAVEEAQHTRPWLRDLKRSHIQFHNQNSISVIRSIEDRALFWLDSSKINELKFFIIGTQLKTTEIINSNYTFEKLLRYLYKNGHMVYYVDITPSFYHFLKIVKVVIPTLQPLYLDESLKEIKLERINRFKQINGLNKNILLNEIPHPFL